MTGTAALRVGTIALLLSAAVAGQNSGKPKKNGAARPRPQNMAVSPLIARLSFALMQEMAHAVQEGHPQSGRSTLAAADNEIERLMQFDVKTAGDLHLLDMVHEASLMADEYLGFVETHELAKANEDLVVIDCLTDIGSAISDRRYASDGHCKVPDQIREATEKLLKAK